MQIPATGKKRLLLIFLPLILLAAVLALLITLDKARPYKKITVSETTLYVPKTYLTDTTDDMLGMLRDYIGTFETNTYQFGAYADEILPQNSVFDDNVANSRLIWTIGPAQGSAALVAEDAALLTGAAPYQNRTINPDPATGLYKLVKSTGNGRTYAFTNSNGNQTASSEQAWVAHCIELASIRRGGPWGRCTRQTISGTLLVQVHFDGRLVAKTAEVSHSLNQLISGWRTKPVE